MKKFFKLMFISVSTVAGLLVLSLVVTTVINIVATRSEDDELQTYGQLVAVEGKNMNVVISGEGSETIVLLPGLGTASPALDFSPLVSLLDDRFRVVVVEPFGYGLSDQTERERTSQNIVEEVHNALQRLGIDRYVLAGHSITGIYALDYINRFRDEVSAFVGIDTSVPTQPGSDDETSLDGVDALKQLGILRLLNSLRPDLYEGLSAYDEPTRRQLSILGNRNAATPTLANEVAHLTQNFAAARTLSFPADLPVLLFVVAFDPEVPGWKGLHEKQIDGVDRGQLVALDGGHYLHQTKSAEIASIMTEFLTTGADGGALETASARESGSGAAALTE